MKRWKWALLIFQLLVCATILILPQVDLPACTFHAGRTPLAVKVLLSSAPAALVTAVLHVSGRDVLRALGSHHEIIGATASGSRLSLLCTLVC